MDNHIYAAHAILEFLREEPAEKWSAKPKPRMGLNAYFTYTVLGFHGPRPVSYNLGVTAVFVEG